MYDVGIAAHAVTRFCCARAPHGMRVARSNASHSAISIITSAAGSKHKAWRGIGVIGAYGGIKA